MESTHVIKVKYGDILRRFSARVVENNQLGINMIGLRTKILSLFNFPPDANFTLKYVDEDGDLVTLVDDGDLDEVMRQHLKLLKIDVNMSNDNGCKSNARSRSSTDLRSPCVSNRNRNRICNAAVVDYLKSVQELVRALSNLSLDLASKAASSSPVISNLAECISKLGQVMLAPGFQLHVAAGLSSKGGGHERPIAPSATGTLSTLQEVETENVTKGVAAPVAPVDLNTLPCDNNLSQSTTKNTAPVSSPVPDGNGRKGKTPNDDSVNVKVASTNNATPGNSSTLPTKMTSISSIEIPFSGVRLVPPPSPSFGNLPIHPFFKRSHRHTEAKGGMLYMVVRCDGCGIFPITGPSFKSKVKENYDLCSICFNEMGNGTDYIRMDPPVSSFPPRSSKGLYQRPLWTGSSASPHDVRTAAMKNVRHKLDSQFSLHVNVIDGTIMAPSTAFTKIWRMRNNGTMAWPKGTQLVWIGGDKFSDTNLVDLQIPVDGVTVDQELDTAVDFKAPESPGRYISYWRMASPSGKKFGQRVWVLIQVDASLKESSFDSYQGLNMNVPPDNSGEKVPELTDINSQPIMDDLQPHNSNASTEPVKQTFDEQSGQELENNSLNDTAFVGNVVSGSPTSGASPSVSCPVVDFSKIVSAVPSNPQSSVVEEPLSSVGIDGKNPVEETLLKELEEMGFKEVDFNKEILRMNQYNLEQSLDYPCGISEWDAILEELNEMGFHDDKINKKLLMKNDGSVKGVVMDLIHGDKA